MPTTLAFKDILDLPKWRPLAPAPAASTAGSSLAFDMRGGGKAHPLHYLLSNATTFSAYSPQNDEWIGLSSPALAGAFGAGASSIVHPTQGPRGTLAAGGTTTSVVLSTALPAAVAVNQLANRGDGVGFTLRVIGNAAGSSGKVEERLIIANTAGTTPTLTLDAALTFTPAVGDTYEILSGRVFLLSAGTLAAGIWKHYDIATNSYSGNLSTTNLPATIGGDSSLVALSEGYVPNDALPGAGFLGVLTATTGATSTTIVQGTASAPALAANEYRNFQIRITEDTATPTAVGQRRRIASHTAGASPTWTVASAWTVTPSATAKFVIENDDDKLLLFTNQTGIYTYNITANSWDTSSFAAAANAGGAGIFCEHSFGIGRDPSGNARHSFIYRIRGGAANIIDLFDLAGGATGVWSADIAYGNKGLTTFTTGTCGAHDPLANGGRYLYLSINGTQRFARFDLRNRVLEPWTYLRYPQGAALVGAKLAMSFFVDGSTKLPFLHALINTGTLLFSIAAQR